MWFLYTCRTVWHRCVFCNSQRKPTVWTYVPSVWNRIVFLSKCICFNLFLTTSDTSLNQISDTWAYWLCVRSNYAHHLLLPFLSSFGHSASRPRDKQMQVSWYERLKHYFLDLFESESCISPLVSSAKPRSVKMLLCVCVNDPDCNNKIMS